MLRLAGEVRLQQLPHATAVHEQRRQVVFDAVHVETDPGEPLDRDRAHLCQPAFPLRRGELLPVVPAHRAPAWVALAIS